MGSQRVRHDLATEQQQRNHTTGYKETWAVTPFTKFSSQTKANAKHETHTRENFHLFSACRLPGWSCATHHHRRLCGQQGGPVVLGAPPLAALSPLVSDTTAHGRASSPSSPPGAVAALFVLSLPLFKFKQRSFGFCWKFYWKDAYALDTFQEVKSHLWGQTNQKHKYVTRKLRTAGASTPNNSTSSSKQPEVGHNQTRPDPTSETCYLKTRFFLKIQVPPVNLNFHLRPLKCAEES